MRRVALMVLPLLASCGLLFSANRPDGKLYAIPVENGQIEVGARVGTNLIVSAPGGITVDEACKPTPGHSSVYLDGSAGKHTGISCVAPVVVKIKISGLSIARIISASGGPVAGPIEFTPELPATGSSTGSK